MRRLDSEEIGRAIPQFLKSVLLGDSCRALMMPCFMCGGVNERGNIKRGSCIKEVRPRDNKKILLPRIF